MPTVLKAQKRLIVMENVTHLAMQGEAVLVFPADFYVLRLTGEDAARALELAKAVGFVGNADYLVNPARLVVAEEEGAIAKLLLDGFNKALMVPVEFLAVLLPAPVEIVSSAGKSAKKKVSE